MTLDEYEREAQSLFAALQADDKNAAWRFKWQHPRFRDKSVSEVRGASLDLDDARFVVAHDYAFETWDDLVAFTRDASVARFESVADAVLTALLFGFAATARALVKRGAPLDQLPTVAALGLIEETSRLLPNADAESRHKALALAAQHGQTETVRLLLDAGEDPNRF